METESGRKRIYIAGPVSGLDYEYACGHFIDAEKRLHEKGWDVVNPVRLCSSTWPWRKCMSVCLKAMLDCDGIYMLKGWKKSRGAKLEHFIALKLGIEILLEK